MPHGQHAILRELVRDAAVQGLNVEIAIPRKVRPSVEEMRAVWHSMEDNANDVKLDRVLQVLVRVLWVAGKAALRASVWLCSVGVGTPLHIVCAHVC